MLLLLLLTFLILEGLNARVCLFDPVTSTNFLNDNDLSQINLASWCNYGVEFSSFKTGLIPKLPHAVYAIDIRTYRDQFIFEAKRIGVQIPMVAADNNTAEVMIILDNEKRSSLTLSPMIQNLHDLLVELEPKIYEFDANVNFLIDWDLDFGAIWLTINAANLLIPVYPCKILGLEANVVYEPSEIFLAFMNIEMYLSESVIM
jgi:hypothetical protein